MDAKDLEDRRACTELPPASRTAAHVAAATAPSSFDLATASVSPAADYLLSRIDYERAIHVPYDQQRFRLERMADFVDRLGNPQTSLPTVHITGSKGKGSTATLIAAMLTASGQRTGLYTSPHLLALEERIRVDGQPISPNALAETLALVRPVVQQMDQTALAAGRTWDRLTFFEIVTGVALVYFHQQRLDAVVLEVGLGGRLDSTNICQPACSVITSISLDHTQQLGDTLAKIATEKAGIIKSGVPVVSGVMAPEAQEVVAARAGMLSCPLHRLGIEFDYRYRPQPNHRQPNAARTCLDYIEPPAGHRPGLRMNDIYLSLLGRHQAANAAIALATMRRLSEIGWPTDELSQRHGLAEARCPARVEIVGQQPLVVLDAAHNGASMQALTKTIDDFFAIPRARRTVIFATTRGKDVTGMLAVLLPWCGRLILTQYLHNPRACGLQQLADMAKRLLQVPSHSPAIPELTLCPDPAAAWQKARQHAGQRALICVTGSFFLAAEMRAILARESVGTPP